MSEKVDNVYSFTTTEDDVYSMRVAEEATEDTNFIITTERNTLLNAHGHAIVLVRKSALEIALSCARTDVGRKDAHRVA